MEILNQMCFHNLIRLISRQKRDYGNFLSEKPQFFEKGQKFTIDILGGLRAASTGTSPRLLFLQFIIFILVVMY